MSEQIKRVGAVTILMWMVGLFMIPVIGYIASNALKMPAIEVYLGNMVTTQKEMVSELKILRESNVAEHKAIAQMVSEHSYGITRMNERCQNNIVDIKECQDDIDFMKNGYGN